MWAQCSGWGRGKVATFNRRAVPRYTDQDRDIGRERPRSGVSSAPAAAAHCRVDRPAVGRHRRAGGQRPGRRPQRRTQVRDLLRPPPEMLPSRDRIGLETKRFSSVLRAEIWSRLRSGGHNFGLGSGSISRIWSRVLMSVWKVWSCSPSLSTPSARHWRTVRDLFLRFEQ